jgi:ribonuclease R
MPEPTKRTGGRFDGMEAQVRSGRDRLISGRLDVHRDGFGFVRPEAGQGSRPGEDIFIPPNEIHGAMQGDLVLVDEAPPGRDGRRSGRIARVLTRRNPTVVGVFHYGEPSRRRGRADSDDSPSGNYVTPMDERVASLILIPEGAEVVAPAGDSPHRTLGDEARAPQATWEPKDRRRPLEGLAVDVEITDFPGPGRPARGRLIEVLGPPDAFGVDVEIVIRKHHIPHTFPGAVLAEAAERSHETVATLSADETADREDFRGLPIVTIDSETARDFDDAVLVSPLANGNTELQVHTSPTSAGTSARAPRSTRRRASAEPASTSPTAPSPCCRTRSRAACAACSPTKTAWCRAASWRSTPAARSSATASPRGSSAVLAA